MSHSTRSWQPKALAETIDESFSKPLPYIDRKPGLGVRVATSSTHTLHQTPPMIWLDRSIADYATPAERALAEGRVQEVTIQNCMPTLESTHRIECEPDVVRPSALYLLHPVHMALTALHPDVSILCMSEPYDQNKIRPDVVYKKKGKIFAVLEFKVPGSMAEEEFSSASMPWASSRTQIMEHKARAPEVEGGGLTHFGDRATTLMKQLTRYVEVVETTKYAALFSWDFLFLSVYDRQDAELIYGTLISRNGNQGAKLRKAYLGWLMEALENEGESKLDPPGGRPGTEDRVPRESRRGRGPPGDGSGPGALGRGSGPGAAGRGSAPQGNDSNDTAKQQRPKRGAGGHDGKTASAHPEKTAPTLPGKTKPVHVGSSFSLASPAAKPPAPTATAALPLRNAHGALGTQGGRQPLGGQNDRRNPVPAKHVPVPKQTQQPKAAQLQQTQPTRLAQQGAKVPPVQKKPSEPTNLKMKKPVPGSSQQR